MRLKAAVALCAVEALRSRMKGSVALLGLIAFCKQNDPESCYKLSLIGLLGLNKFNNLVVSEKTPPLFRPRRMSNAGLNNCGAAKLRC